MKKSIRLNLGCGATKLDDYINIDVEPSVKPDLILNFVQQPLPYKSETVDRVVLFHTIEHISKKYHRPLLLEVHRVLKPDGRLIVTYPEFLACVERWKNNTGGIKEFWEATLYGRQLFASDFHVCIMHTPDFKYILEECGFLTVTATPELNEKHNTIVTCARGVAYKNYENLCLDEMARVTLKRSDEHKSPTARKHSR